MSSLLCAAGMQLAEGRVCGCLCSHGLLEHDPVVIPCEPLFVCLLESHNSFSCFFFVSFTI